jgi:hypothetical protein
MEEIRDVTGWRFVPRTGPHPDEIMVHSDEVRGFVVDQAPKFGFVNSAVLAAADPRLVAMEDRIVTFCPTDDSRASYRQTNFDPEREGWHLERIQRGKE